MIKDMCIDAGIEGHKTNHSLRATGASELFEAGVPEKIIKERTGHRSLEALRVYERTTMDQQKAVSALLSSEKKKSFQQAIQHQSINIQHQQPQVNQPQINPSQQVGPYQVFNNCSVVINAAPGTSTSPVPNSVNPPSHMPPLDDLTSADFDLFFGLNN